MEDSTADNTNAEQTDVDNDQWGEAFDDFAKENGAEVETSEDKEDNTPETDTEEKDADSEKQVEDSQETAQEEVEQPPVDDRSRNLREQRAYLRETVEERQAIKEDVRKELFSDISDTIYDEDGDPINTIEDVMQRLNPETGEAFTEDEAARWLLLSQQKLGRLQQDAEQRADAIADTNLSLKDQADNIKDKYGELLEALPGLREQIWGEYERTLVKDEASGIIVSAPVSLESFYETALRGYAKTSELLQQQYEEQQAQQQKAKSEQQKQNQSERADIYSSSSDGGGGDNDDWVSAAKDYYND